MDCTQARGYLPPYADGELDPITSQSVGEHLRRCATCERSLQELTLLRSLVKKALPYYTAPRGLAERIRAQVADSPKRVALRWTPVFWDWLRPAALVAVTAVVTWIAASNLNAPSRDELIVAQVIAGHARSVVAQRLADVASSDQHTVKPWLSAKLDFSPPVVDLTTAGFPLVGGRVDYMDNRPCAALVYRHRQHVIDLFIWPQATSGRSSTAQAFAKNGYQVLHWRDGGMTFWAISDLNAADMKSFAETFESAVR